MPEPIEWFVKIEPWPGRWKKWRASILVREVGSTAFVGYGFYMFGRNRDKLIRRAMLQGSQDRYYYNELQSLTETVPVPDSPHEVSSC